MKCPNTAHKSHGIFFRGNRVLVISLWRDIHQKREGYSFNNYDESLKRIECPCDSLYSTTFPYHGKGAIKQSWGDIYPKKDSNRKNN